ncbi:hypothetical protein [Actinokineospora spheciospongiae]|uniref:hypothetical protein n=1 Tax=Actinokineospora spheciospongiae TaxID=909613 RepID=UPI000D71A852|nr:hypothetical protein [Actinokineospora spheciospongiae]PWW58284.1 hypothetical protein DFQ13_10975 [Actinokineospora spheciospongiae]
MHSTAHRTRGQEPPAGRVRPGDPAPWTLSPTRRDSDRITTALLAAVDPATRPGGAGPAVSDGVARLARRLRAAVLLIPALLHGAWRAAFSGLGGPVAVVVLGVAPARGTDPPGRPRPRTSTLGQVGEHLPEGNREAA